MNLKDVIEHNEKECMNAIQKAIDKLEEDTGLTVTNVFISDSGHVRKLNLNRKETTRKETTEEIS